MCALSIARLQTPNSLTTRVIIKTALYLKTCYGALVNAHDRQEGAKFVASSESGCCPGQRSIRCSLHQLQCSRRRKRMTGRLACKPEYCFGSHPRISPRHPLPKCAHGHISPGMGIPSRWSPSWSCSDSADCSIHTRPNHFGKDISPGFAAATKGSSPRQGPAMPGPHELSGPSCCNLCHG